MNFSHRVVSRLDFLWLFLFCAASGSLDCTFKDGFCDWKKTVNQCSWKFGTICAFNVPGCVYVTVNSGTNCSSVGLKANMKKQGNRGIYFEYFMTGFSGGSLLLKDDVGIILWSCSHVQAPKWRSAQILLKNEQHTKAIIIEANLDPDSSEYIAVRRIEQAEKINPSTSCSSYLTDATSLTGIHTFMTTTKDFETTEEEGEETTLTHSQNEVHQETETHSNTPGEPDISTRKTLVSVFPDPTPQTHHVMSVTLIAAIVTGIICSIPVFGIVIYLIVNGVRKNKSVFHVSRSVHLNPVTTDE